MYVYVCKYVCMYIIKKEEIFLILSGFFCLVWELNWHETDEQVQYFLENVDMGGFQKNCVTCQNAWSPGLKYCLQLKIKEDIEVGGSPFCEVTRKSMATKGKVVTLNSLVRQS